MLSMPGLIRRKSTNKEKKAWTAVTSAAMTKGKRARYYRHGRAPSRPSTPLFSRSLPCHGALSCRPRLFRIGRSVGVLVPAHAGGRAHVDVGIARGVGAGLAAADLEEDHIGGRSVLEVMP